MFMAKTGGVGPSPPFFRLCSTLLDEMLCFAEHFRQPKEQSVHKKCSASLKTCEVICRQQSIQTACLQRPVALLSWKPLKMFVFQPLHRKSMAWHCVKRMSGMSHARFSLDAICPVGSVSYSIQHFNFSTPSQKVSLKTQLLKEVVPQILKIFATSHSKSSNQEKRKFLDLLGSVCAESISHSSPCSSFTAATTLAGGLKCTALSKQNPPFSYVQLKALRCCRTCITCLVMAHGSIDSPAMTGIHHSMQLPLGARPQGPHRERGGMYF